MKRIIKPLILLLFLVIILLPLYHFYGDNIYASIVFDKSTVVQVDENVYRCPKDSHKDFLNYMKNSGWTFTEQMGSGYFFEKKDEKVVCCVSIKNLYAEWTVTAQ